MFWPTGSPVVPLQELGWVNTSYLATANARCDPTIVWGTQFCIEPLEQFVHEQRRQTGTMISTAHVLLRAVAEALQRHPLVNRRVIGRRVYPYDGVHLTMPMLETRSGEVNIVYLQHADRMSLAEIARRIWEEARNVAVRTATAEKRKQSETVWQRMTRLWSAWFRIHWVHRMAGVGFWVTNRLRLPTLTLHEINGTSAFVNHLGFAGAPPMIAYKPSSLPTNSFGVSVTLGTAEKQAVVDGSAVVIRTMAPLFVRVDHRLVNGYQTAAFISTLRSLLEQPGQLAASTQDPHAARTAA